MKTHPITTLVLMVALSLPMAADNFTPAEQQQISIATPGLFDKSKSFTVDLSVLPQGDWSFPLPVGTAQKGPGLDLTITTTPGDAVKAMFDGRVRLARHVAGHGNTVVIRHGNGLETVYARLRGATVKPGDRVEAGQTVGIVGEEGGKGVCRFGMMVNGFAVNVETFVDVVRKRLRRQSYLFTDRGIAVDIAALGNASDEPDITEGEPEPGAAVDAETVDIDGELTDYERRVVSAPTKGLFDKSATITINLHKYQDGDWAYPLPGAKVISPYGGKRRHAGVDLKTKPNDEILAAFPGRVRFSGNYYGYGRVVVVRHANGMETLYSHNSKNLVEVGEWVKAGQPIALTGRTGRATTEHLHFEVRINGKTYDPARFFDHKNRCLKKVKVVAHKSGKVTTTSAGQASNSLGRHPARPQPPPTFST